MLGEFADCMQIVVKYQHQVSVSCCVRSAQGAWIPQERAQQDGPSASALLRASLTAVAPWLHNPLLQPLHSFPAAGVVAAPWASSGAAAELSGVWLASSTPHADRSSSATETVVT